MSSLTAELQGREIVIAYVKLPSGFTGLALVIGDEIVLTLTDDNDILTLSDN